MFDIYSSLLRDTGLCCDVSLRQALLLALLTQKSPSGSGISDHFLDLAMALLRRFFTSSSDRFSLLPYAKECESEIPTCTTLQNNHSPC